MPFSEIDKSTRTKITSILDAVDLQRDIYELKSIGLLYSQIADLIGLAIENGYLEYSRKGLAVTGLGRKFLLIAGNRSKITSPTMIQPLDDRRVDRLALSEVHLPSRHIARSLRGAGH